MKKNHTAANTNGSGNAFTRAINRLRTPLLAIASAIFLTALLSRAGDGAGAGRVLTHGPRGRRFQSSDLRARCHGSVHRHRLRGQLQRGVGRLRSRRNVDRANVTTTASGTFSSTYPLGSVTGRYIFNVMEVGDQVATGEFALGPAPTPQCDQTRHETIQANLLHYLPGDTVSVTGSGFAPSCEVLMAVNVPDGTHGWRQGDHRCRRQPRLLLPARPRHRRLLGTGGDHRRRDLPRDDLVLERHLT